MNPPLYMTDAVGVLANVFLPSIFTIWAQPAPANAKMITQPSFLITSSPCPTAPFELKNGDALLQGWNIAKLIRQFQPKLLFTREIHSLQKYTPESKSRLAPHGFGAYDAC